MPTKNEPIELTGGTLYMLPQDGGGQVQLGKVKSLEITTEQLGPPEYLDDFGNPVPYICQRYPSQEVTIELEPLGWPQLFWLTRDPLCAVKWANDCHPRWVHLARYAKTGRRRTKNIRRIIRAFIEEVAHCAENG